MLHIWQFKNIIVTRGIVKGILQHSVFAMKLNLCRNPNGRAAPPGIFAHGANLLIRGYQEFALTRESVHPGHASRVLLRKQQLSSPFLLPTRLSGKTVLDLGANGGFFTFMARQNGARWVTALEMDKSYLELIHRAQEHLQLDRIEPVHARVQDWNKPADIVLAFALVHWLFSCTAAFGSLDQVVAKLAALSRHILLVEWVAPNDEAIRAFKHTEWNSDIVSGPYSLDAFEQALERCFAKIEVLGNTSETRILYAAHCRTAQVDLQGPLPLLAPAERVISSRLLAEHQGVKYYSRVYEGDAPNTVVKQATGDLAWQEFQILELLTAVYFPRPLKAFRCQDYSILILERMEGEHLSLSRCKRRLGCNLQDLSRFFHGCLEILRLLQINGVRHRDITLENMMIKSGSPVLLDFGWAETERLPSITPPGLGGIGRKPDGTFSDTYAMGKIFEQLAAPNVQLFGPLLKAMVQGDHDLGFIQSLLLQVEG